MSKSIRGSKEFWNFSPAFIGVNLLIAVGLSVAFCPSCFVTPEKYGRLAEQFGISFVMSCALSYGGYWFEHYFDQRISWIKFPVRRLVLEYLSYSTYVFVISFIVIFIHLYFIRQSITLNDIPWARLIQFTKSPLIIAVIISALFISRSFLFEWRNAAIEAEQLKTERFAQQYQSLKDQLNPHFLFNSLNVLSNVVYENQDTAVRFIRQLSQIYRYVLDVQQEQLVTVHQELGFAENYLSLQKIRFEDSLQYNINVPKSLSGLIPPLSLQLLLENAVKHNVASTEHPLRIEIFEENQFLVVRNNLQRKTSLPDESAGVGLGNIRKRYELLNERNIDVSEADGHFTVKLPILHV